MTPRKPKQVIQIASRALFRMAGHPEDSKFEGKPMWESFLPAPDAVIEAIGWKDEEGNIMQKRQDG